VDEKTDLPGSYFETIPGFALCFAREKKLILIIIKLQNGELHLLKLSIDAIHH